LKAATKSGKVRIIHLLRIKFEFGLLLLWSEIGHVISTIHNEKEPFKLVKRSAVETVVVKILHFGIVRANFWKMVECYIMQKPTTSQMRTKKQEKRHPQTDQRFNETASCCTRVSAFVLSRSVSKS